MKKFIFLLVAMAAMSFANAQKVQEKDIPALVKTGLQKQFPNARNIKWEKEKSNYEAGFKLNGTDYSALISTSGNLLETEESITMDKLPAVIKDYVSKKYPGKKIKESVKITDTKGVVTYEAEVNNADLIFNSSGKFLKQVKE